MNLEQFGESTDFNAHLVNFVGDEHPYDARFSGVGVDLRQPHVQLSKGVPVGHVVHHDHSLAASVVAGRQGAEALLTGGVLTTQTQPFVLGLTQ